MGWEFDLDNIDPEKIDSDFPVPGNYHVEITHVAEDGDEKSNGAMVVDYEILAGSTPNQEGKTQRDYFSKSAEAAKRAIMLALAAGLTTVEELRKAKDAGKHPIIHFSDAVGRQLCIGVEAEEYQGKMRNKVGFRIWALDSPNAAGIPLNKGKLATEGEAKTPDDPFGGADIF